MAEKFIPDSDSDFANMARIFADKIAENPGRFFLEREDSDRISRKVTAFRDALARAIWRPTKTKTAVMAKDAARGEAERIVRKYGAVIRADDRIQASDKRAIDVRERPTRLRRRECPQPPPHLDYRGAEDRVHILRFSEKFGAARRAKPFGAVRLELFVELVAPGQAVPKMPGDRPWYLRSFTTTPMRVQFPMPRTPMLVVYWARWADAKGNVGRFSQTVKARVEGWPAETSGSAGAGEAGQKQEPRQAA